MQSAYAFRIFICLKPLLSEPKIMNHIIQTVKQIIIFCCRLTFWVTLKKRKFIAHSIIKFHTVQCSTFSFLYTDQVKSKFHF